MTTNGTVTTIDAEIAGVQTHIKELETQLARLRARRPREQVTDYTLTGRDGEQVKLSSLFGDKEDLILIHNMGSTCGYCTMWADGFSAIYPRVEERAAFALAGPDGVDAQRAQADARGWTFRMVSAKDTSLFKDMGFESDEGQPWPGVSTFHKNPDGKIERYASAPFGPGDKFCSVFSFYDLLPGGKD